MKEILNDVLKEFQNPDKLRIGFFANNLSKELVVTVEEDPFEFGSIEKDKTNIEDELDLILNVQNKKTCYAYSYTFLPLLNGVEHHDTLFVEPHD